MRVEHLFAFTDCICHFIENRCWIEGVGFSLFFLIRNAVLFILILIAILFILILIAILFILILMLLLLKFNNVMPQ
jgi:hypothetical protein